MSFEKEQKGGVYLMQNDEKLEPRFEKIEETQKSTGYPYTFEPKPPVDGSANIYINGVITMLLNAVEVKCMSYKSLKGFIFIIDVGKDASGNVRDELQFFTASRKCIGSKDTDCIPVNINKNVPISKFLLKLTFLEEKTNNLNLIELSHKLNTIEGTLLFDNAENLRKIRKQKDLVDTFKKEAQTQQHLFKQEFLNDPVTYGIIASCQIESIDSMYLLHLMRSKANDPVTYQVIQAMVDSRECRCPIGLIAMEYGENYEVLSEHVKLQGLENYKNDKNAERQSKLYANIFFKILLMLNIFNDNDRPHIVHMDLHQNNIMAYNNIVINHIYNINSSNNDIYKDSVNFLPFTYIIDFGRIVDISLNIRDMSFGHLNPKNKNKNEAGSYINRKPDIKITKETIKKIIKLLLFEEFKYYKTNFNENYIQSFHVYEDFFDRDKIITKLKEFVNGKEISELKYDELKLVFDDASNFDTGDNANFNTFCEYVNDLIHYYFVLIQPTDAVLVSKETLYDGETYTLTKKDLKPKQTRVKDRNGMILYDTYKPNMQLNQSDLTTYVKTGSTDVSDESDEKYEEIVKNMKQEEKEELIQKLRKALLTNNFEGINFPELQQVE